MNDNTQEFSDKFDTLIGAYKLDTKFAEESILDFDEYEKSVFLSQAQKDLVVELYSGRNQKGLSFESTEEARRLLHNLTKTYIEDNLEGKEIVINKPSDLMFITFEKCELATGKEVSVVPVRQDYLDRTLKNPFKKPNKKRVLRIDRNNSIELISNYDISSYTMEYLKFPNPIVLIDFENLSIDGISTKSSCELDKTLWDEIIERAVALAIAKRNIILTINNSNTNK